MFYLEVMKYGFYLLLMLSFCCRAETKTDALGELQLGKTSGQILPLLAAKYGTPKLISSNDDMAKCADGSLYVVKEGLMVVELINDMCPDVTTYYLPEYTIGKASLRKVIFAFYKDTLFHVAVKENVRAVEGVITPRFGKGERNERSETETETCTDAQNHGQHKKGHYEAITYRYDDTVQCYSGISLTHNKDRGEKLVEFFLLLNTTHSRDITQCNHQSYLKD